MQQYISPGSKLFGQPAPIPFHPLESVPNVSVSVTTDTGVETLNVREMLSYYINHCIKIPPELRAVLVANLEPNVTRRLRLELPFLSLYKTYATEIFWGESRIFVYDDPNYPGVLRCIPIPLDESDPELHYAPQGA